MTASEYIANLRARIGNRLLLLPSVAAVIHDREGRLLLQKKPAPESWSLPAGGIEPGETPEEALRREVQEETGSVVHAAELVQVFGGEEFRYCYPNGHEVEYTVIVFRCELGAPPSAARDSETVELRYFARGEMPKLALPYPESVLFGR